MTQVINKTGLQYYTSKIKAKLEEIRSLGRFLSNWNAVTGLPMTNPTTNPYTFHTGDYMLIDVVASTGGTNYRPSGSSYTIGVPSTVVETEKIGIGDIYLYDGTVWLLLKNTTKDTNFANIGGSPYDNANLASALNAKADTDDLATVATSGSYDDLSNKPTIPAAQVPADWNATTGVARILNKPTIPTVPTNVSAFTNDANYQTGTQVSSAISTHNSSSSAHSSLFNAKQNTITGGATTITSSNLTTNRALISDASGKVAVSAVTSTELGYLDGVTSAIQTQLNGKATSSDITNAISTHNSSTSAHSDIRSAVASKSTVSVSATGTATDEVKYITIDGVQKKIGGGSEEDNLSITKNASDKIQTVGVIDDNDNSTAIKTWTGTLAEYQALATKDSDTLYNITDDISGGTSVYTKDQVDGLLANKANVGVSYTKAESDGLLTTMLRTLYPVGSIYIGTQASCPLASLINGSTWVLVSAGRSLQGADSSHSAGSTIEAGLPNITGKWSPTYGWLSGASYQNSFAAVSATLATGNGSSQTVNYGIDFNASRSSSIYGNSTTVQPPAYVVNVWRRTA